MRNRALAQATAVAALLASLALGCSGVIHDGAAAAQVDEGPGPAVEEPGPGAPDSRPALAGKEFECGGKTPDPGPSIVRRLTRAEHARSVQIALGVDVGAAITSIPAEGHGEIFSNDVNAQLVSYEHVDGWAKVADAVVAKIAMPAFLSAHAPCTRDEASCRTGFVESVAKKLHRRPVDPADRAALVALFDAATKDGGTFADGAAMVLSALLQSPRFLYRVERQEAEPRELDGFEIASRLSFLAWGSAPDDALLSAADKGELASEAALGAQIDRLLADPRAKEAGRQFVSDWLDLERLDRSGDPLASDMRAETESAFEQVAFAADSPLSELFRRKSTRVSNALAKHYGLQAPKEGIADYDLSAVPERIGILTQASVLSSGDSGASLVNRGLFLLRNALCLEVGAPPPGVNNARPMATPGKSQRYYSEERTKTPPCNGCHVQIDPLAYAFTRYDARGALIEKDEGGNVPQTDGTFVTPYDPAGRNFTDAATFAETVASDRRVQDCMILKPWRFATGRPVDAADACTLASIRTRLAGQTSYRAILRAVALEPTFRRIRGGS
jgi:hypothetical protein